MLQTFDWLMRARGKKGKDGPDSSGGKGGDDDDGNGMGVVFTMVMMVTREI